MDRSLARLLKIVLLIAALGLVLPASGALGAKPLQTAKQPTATASPRRPRSGPQRASPSSPTKPCRPQPSRSAAAGEALSWRTLSAEVNRKL
jgi:hypothetical protein